MIVCFFFFKQKTAYEMRISDWSSDVCSSDLWILVPDAEAAADALPGLAERVFLSVGRQEVEAFSALPRLWFLVRMIDAPRGALPLHRYDVVLGRGPFEESGERALFLLHGKIGRASGRERGCQSV